MLCPSSNHARIPPGWLAVCLLLSGATLVPAQTAGQIRPAANPPAITPKDVLSERIDDQLIEPLPSSVHPRARVEYDVGPVPQDLSIPRMTLLLRRSSAQQAALDALVAAQQDPQSPEYHKWLTPEEFGGRFGLSQNDLDKLTAWLKHSGFVIDEIPKGRWTIIFSGTAGQVEAAFRTQIHYYAMDGIRHRANATPLWVLKSLVPVLDGVLGIHDFLPVPFGHGLLVP